MNRKERRWRAKRVSERRRKIARIRAGQGYYVPDPDNFSDGYYRDNNFLCHYYGSIKIKRKFRQLASSRYWKHRPHFWVKSVNYCRNELRQMNRMDADEKDYYQYLME